MSHLSHASKRRYRVVGHRGNPYDTPENSIEGVLSALDLGVDAVEVDIQLSADGVCMVVHDAELGRTSSAQDDISGPVCEQPAAKLKTLSIHEPNRFGARYYPCFMPTLQDFCNAIQQRCKEGATQVFLELKKESLGYFSRPYFVKQLLVQSAVLGDLRCVISFDYALLAEVRHQCSLPIGWVLTDYNQQSFQQAQDLKPDFLISNKNKLPDRSESLWQGEWQWFIYDSVDQKEAVGLVARGAAYIESWRPALFSELQYSSES